MHNQESSQMWTRVDLAPSTTNPTSNQSTTWNRRTALKSQSGRSSLTPSRRHCKNSCFRARIKGHQPSRGIWLLRSSQHRSSKTRQKSLLSPPSQARRRTSSQAIYVTQRRGQPKTSTSSSASQTTISWKRTPRKVRSVSKSCLRWISLFRSLMYLGFRVKISKSIKVQRMCLSRPKMNLLMRTSQIRLKNQMLRIGAIFCKPWCRVLQTPAKAMPRCTTSTRKSKKRWTTSGSNTTRNLLQLPLINQAKSMLKKNPVSSKFMRLMRIRTMPLTTMKTWMLCQWRRRRRRKNRSLKSLMNKHLLSDSSLLQPNQRSWLKYLHMLKRSSILFKRLSRIKMEKNSAILFLMPSARG